MAHGARRIGFVVIAAGAALAAGCGGGGTTASPDAAVDAAGDGPGAIDAGPDAAGARFSFFVTSLATMRLQAGSQDGFGGNLGGLAGADAICQRAAADQGFGDRTWRAFLSVARGPGGGPVHAIDRIGAGPWYDRLGRLIALDRAGLLQQRPAGDPVAVSDMADETGAGTRSFGDTHDIMTGSNQQGMLDGVDATATCGDWTSAVGPGSENKVRAGHSWPAMSGMHWIMAHRLPGCAPGVRLTITPPGEQGNTVGGQGGWGGIYCFALTP
jgi:hypothetical protein